MAIKRRVVPQAGTSVTLEVPESSIIPDDPIGFRWDKDLKKLLWERDTNTETDALTDHFEVWLCITGPTGTYNWLANVDNPTSGSVEYKPETSFAGYWYKIRGVNGRGDYSYFTHLVEHPANTCRVRFSFLKSDGTPLTDVGVTAKIVSTSDAPFGLDGKITQLTNIRDSAYVNALSGAGVLDLKWSSEITNAQYTITVANKKFSTSKALTIPDATEAWLTINSSNELQLEVRAEGV